jgi:FlaG protein
MTIEPLSGSSGLAATGSPPAEGVRPAGRGHPVGSVRPAGPGALAAAAPAKDLRRLQAVASQTGLQVRFETLPQSNMTVIRLLDSQTGRVVVQFPPEGVAQALADLEARSAARPGRQALDHHA